MGRWQSSPSTSHKETFVTEHSTPAALARAFTEAWASHDLDTAAGYLADDVTFQGPVAGQLTGKQAYMAGLTPFARNTTGLNILAAFGDDSQALIMYEAATATSGTLTCAELLTFRDGKIVADRLTFDTFPVRGSAGAGQPPTPSTPAQ